MVSKTKQRTEAKAEKAKAERKKLALTSRADVVHNALESRTNFFKSILEADGKDINAECGYPDDIGVDDYSRMYDREGIGARVVQILPQESWAGECMVYESQEATETAFETAFNVLAKRLNIYSELEQLDELSGIGRYGIMLHGFNDGGELKDPVKIKKGMQLLYVRNFDESQCEIESVESNKRSPRYGEPTMYRINLADAKLDPAFKEMIRKAGAKTDEGVKVHWTRVQHLASADHAQTHKVLGIPRMQQVFNRLVDLRKVLGGSAEMFWKGGFPGYAFSIDSDVDPADIDEEAMREEYERYQLGLQRYLAMLGVTVTSLATQIADPSPQVRLALENIAISKGVPIRIFMGSERGELASSQDEVAWAKRMGRRQEKHLEPHIIRVFVDRMMELEILPAVEEYFVWWESPFEPSKSEQAATAALVVKAMADYVSAGIDTILIAPKEFMVDILGYDLEQVEIWMEAVEEHAAEMEAKAAELAAEADQLVDEEQDDEEEDTPVGNEDVENAWTEEARQASIEVRRASNKTHSVNLPEKMSRLTMDQAGQALKELGLKLGMGSFDLETKTQMYEIVTKGGHKVAMDVGKIRSLVYETRLDKSFKVRNEKPRKKVKELSNGSKEGEVKV